LQGDVPQFEHAKDQLCGNRAPPVSTWTPAILLDVYSLAWTSIGQKPLTISHRSCRQALCHHSRILMSQTAFRWDNHPFGKIVALVRMR